MTAVRLVLSSEGRLCSCKANGHAGFSSKGTDIVCAAVTVLLRTTLQVLEKTEGVQTKFDAGSRGKIELEVTQLSFDESTNAKLEYAGSFLQQGFSSLAREFPENVELQV